MVTVTTLSQLLADVRVSVPIKPDAALYVVPLNNTEPPLQIVESKVPTASGLTVKI